MRIIAFDLDETLGEFIYLSVLWNQITNQINNVNLSHFFYLCDLFPEFFRPHIFEILKRIADNKNYDDKIVIYTNNNGQKSWTLSIVAYIEHKLNMKIFDQVICAYKVNGMIIEPNRTSYDKIYSDLIRCVKAPYGSSVCFIDDRLHEAMRHPSVDYIQVKPYHCKFKKRDVMRRLERSQFRFLNNNETLNNLREDQDYNKNKSQEDYDLKVTQEMFLRITRYLLNNRSEARFNRFNFV